MKTLIRVLDQSERYLMLVCYTFCCFVITQEVLRRFVLNFSSAWAEETARYLFIYLGWLGAALAVKERAHIRFDIIFNVIPSKWHNYIFLLGEVLTILFAVIVLYYSMHTMGQLLRFGAETPVLRVDKAWFEAAIPVSFALIVVRALQRILGDIQNITNGSPPFKGKTLFEE